MTTRKTPRASLMAATKLSLALSLSPLVMTPADAQWIVYDPTNFSQNVLTAARELQQINNQIQMLTNQSQSLVNQAKNLARRPSGITTANRDAVIGCLSWVSGRLLLPFALPPPRLTMLPSNGYSPSTAARILRRPGSRITSSCGPLTSSPT